MISIVVAVSKNNVIGVNNELPWHLPADLKHFKKLTTGKVVVMGRKTFESIGKPLPNRTNVVITRNPDWKQEGVVVCGSMEEVLKSFKEDVCVIGGTEVFKESIDFVDVIYMTIINECFVGDSDFPKLGDEWVLVKEDKHQPDEKNPHEYSFCEFIKVSEDNKKPKI
jgi:dihydrofolate reductase